jgi:uncharacterized membrane protein
MESKPRKLKKRRVRTPKTFKQKLQRFIKNQFGVNSWTIIILIPFLMGIITLTILFWVINIVDSTNTNTNTSVNKINIVTPK